MGYVYRHGKTWWAQYFVDGRRIRESTGLSARTTPKKTAQEFLKRREGLAAEGRPTPPRFDRMRYDELAAADLRRHYRTSGARNLEEAEKRLRPLDAAFRGRRAASIGSEDLTAYVERRQAAGRANATINRELAMLRHVFRFAYDADPPKVARVPVIRLLKESAPRAGFFEAEQYAAVRRRLRHDLQLACDLAYHYGWRMRDEILPLQWRQVDLTEATLRLDVGQTKGEEGRLVYLTPVLHAALLAQRERIRALERTARRVIPFVFAHATDGALNPTTGQRRYVVGDPIRDFRRAWLTACKRAGLAGRLRHDFRRTAAPNLINDGTPEKVAMQVLGHRTRSIFDRYHIVAPEDLRAATARMAVRQSHNSHSDSHKLASAGEMGPGK
jgi:integrase